MDFFAVHPNWLVFLFFMAILPRITLLITGIAFATFLYPIWFWIGFIFWPRLVIAILATTIYWHTNPILCVFAWMLALGVTVGSGSAAKSINKS